MPPAERKRGTRRRPEPGWSQPPGEERERRHIAPELRTVYVVLGTIIAASAGLSVFAEGVPWVDRFAAGVTTDSFGILLTLVFVHRLLERQERSRRLRGSIGALRRGSRALHELVEAWAQLVKATLPRIPGDPTHSLVDLFAQHHVENVTYADPRRMRMEAGADPEPWVRWTARRVEAARETLNKTIEAYSASLDPAYVEAIDEVVDDGFLRLFETMTADGTEVREWRIRMNAARATRETFFARLTAAVKLHNQLAKEASTVRSRRIAPRTGSVGMELPLDHDLRVELELPKRWWSSDPAVGVARFESDKIAG